MKKYQFIAEVKPQSPFGFKSNYTYEQLLAMAHAYGDIVSIHTDPLWGSSPWDLVRYAQSKNHKPILAKGVHEHDIQIENSLKAGAKFVLVVGRIPPKKYLKDCFLEPLNQSQANQMAKLGNKIAGLVINSRDLETGEPRRIDFEVNTKSVKLVQASNIKHPDRVYIGTDYYIVGEHLPTFILSKRLQELKTKWPKK